MTTTKPGPTPKKEWAKEGDSIVSSGGMRGTVLRVFSQYSIPVVRVAWENGHEGRLTITQVRVVSHDDEVKCCEYSSQVTCPNSVVALVECGATIFLPKQGPYGYRSARWMCAPHRAKLGGKFREVAVLKVVTP